MLEELVIHTLNKIGTKDIVHPIFFNAPIGLRFEIGIGEVYDEDFEPKEEYLTNAYRRASRLIKGAIPNPSILVWDIYEDDEFNFDSLLETFMRVSGLGLPEEKVCSKEIIEDESIDKMRYYWDLRDSRNNLEDLIKAIIVADIGGFSKLVSSVFIIDVHQHIICHLYDDRGMDIVGERVKDIRHLYRNFNDWILDHNRECIDSVFN